MAKTEPPCHVPSKLYVDTIAGAVTIFSPDAYYYPLEPRWYYESFSANRGWVYLVHSLGYFSADRF
jgi:hypothetical protein